MEALIRRLKERKLVQWALAYAAAAFALVQITDIVANRFHWPEWVVRWCMLGLLFGFAVTLVLAWYHGERGQQHISSAELSIFAALLLVAGVGASAMRSPAASRAALEVGTAESIQLKTLAVLPFTSLSDSSVNANFADGIHDALLTQLSRISDLQVISRVSVMPYRNTSKPLRQIARELGAGSIVEASVQRAGGQVRIEAKLIDARTDRHIWAETYTRGAEDVFAVETEVARGIAQALHAALTAREHAALSQAAHTSPQAYDLYLRGREYLTNPSLDQVEAAERLLERAVQIDPRFADAWGALAIAYEFHSLNTPPYVPNLQGEKGAAEAMAERARATAQHALRLRPDVAEAHIALGWDYYWQRHDVRASLREFELARQILPSSEEAWAGISVALRALGRWDEALAASRKSAALAPRGDFSMGMLATNYAAMWRYPEAIQTLERMISLSPELAMFAGRIAQYRFEEDGDTARLRKSLEALPPRDVYGIYLMGPSGRPTDPARDLREISRLPDFIESAAMVAPRVLLRAYLHGIVGDSVAARSDYDAARVMLESAVQATPDEPRFRTALAWAYSGLGRRADAIREGRRAVELCPESRDANLGPLYARMLAATYAYGGGDKDRAFRLLEHLIQVPNGVTVAELRFNDAWDALRSDARFPTLVAAAEAAQRR